MLVVQEWRMVAYILENKKPPGGNQGTFGKYFTIKPYPMKIRV